MQKSDSIKELAAALAKAQGEIVNATKDATNDCANNSGYATLASVWNACRKALSSNGIGVIQSPEVADGNLIVTTMLAHNSGEWMCSALNINPARWDGHGIGSAITYARRYALAAMVGVAPEDDDGNGAMAKPEARQQAREKESAKHSAKPAAELNPLPPVILGDGWKQVICHVGKGTRDKPVGELTREQWHYLAVEWKPADKLNTIKNTNLINACNAALAANPVTEEKKEETPAPATESKPELPQELPLDKPAAPAEPTNPPAEKPAMEWRSVICTIGASGKIKGRSLGDIVMTPRGEDPKIFDDGAALLRTLVRGGLPHLAKKGDKATIQEKILANAIRAAAAELNPFDDEAWLKERDEKELREEIERRLTEAGITMEHANKVFEESADVLEKCNDPQLRYLLNTWPMVLKAMKGAN